MTKTGWAGSGACVRGLCPGRVVRPTTAAMAEQTVDRRCGIGGRRRAVAALLSGIVAIGGRTASASGHGPVFGLATPTIADASWALDIGVMGRHGAGEQGAMTRAMLTYGLTEDVQLSFSAPLVFASAPFAPARGTAMMSGSGDFEAMGAWRFHRRAPGIGRRTESTAYGGLIVPGPQKPAGMLGDLARASGFYAAVASGFASRSHYAWGGIGYTGFLERRADRRSDILSYSVVWGYRPAALRKEYPDWDWRVFVEMTGERSGNLRRGRIDVAGTGGHQILLGPTALGIYRNSAIEGGVQFLVHRDIGARLRKETVRYAVNFSYFF